MSVQIVTGYTGERHITPYMDATVNRGIFGEDGCILSSGGQMSASMPDINTFVIADGAFSIQGHVGITNGETLTVDTCASGSRRIDLVVARFEHDASTNIDTMSIVLLKGTETTSQYPTTPTYRTGTIADGANVDLPLYQITLNGSTVTFSGLLTVLPNLDFVEKNIKKPIRIVNVTGTQRSLQEGSSFKLTPPTITGYSFMCWLSCSFSGWAGSVAFAYPTSPATTFYVTRFSDTESSVSRTVTPTGYALYIREDLA